MLINRSGAFTASEEDVPQTGGNVHILHLKLDYFFAFVLFLQEVFSSLKSVKSQCFDIAVSSYRQEDLRESLSPSK